jgi:hypothetical protein
MQTFRVFVSSRGDVTVEQRRVENVVSRLNDEFDLRGVNEMRQGVDLYVRSAAGEKAGSEQSQEPCC